MPTHNDETLLERYQRERRVYEGMKMSKAEELALKLDAQVECGGGDLYELELAATELRRLSAINAELLEALKAISSFIPTTSAKEGGAAKFSENFRAADAVRAAIAKAQGEQL